MKGDKGSGGGRMEGGREGEAKLRKDNTADPFLSRLPSYAHLPS